MEFITTQSVCVFKGTGGLFGGETREGTDLRKRKGEINIRALGDKSKTDCQE